MKRTYKVCLVLMVAVFGVGRPDVGWAAPTSAVCKEAFASIEAQCSEYSVTSSSLTSGQVFYICTCVKCNSGYHIAGNHSQYKYYGADYLHLPNGCAVGDSTGGGSTTQTCSTGSLCTMCKGPSVTINGQIYCGMWADTKAVKTCSGSPGSNVSYTMSACCNSDGQAVGNISGCYVGSCKTGFTPNDNKTACICDVGYYGNTNSCTRCPAFDGVNGFTAGRGKTQITDCYFPAGFEFSDTSGTFEYTKDCYY